MQRIKNLKQHLQDGSSFLTTEKCVSESQINTDSDIETNVNASLSQIPVVKATMQTTDDPINFLLETAQQYPDLFFVDRGGNNRYLVVSDAHLYEDILTFDKKFGNPQAPNMLVNKTVFQIPKSQLDKHEQNVISGLRRYLLNHNAELADKIAVKLLKYMKERLGESGTLDLRQFGEAIFWPMTETLFGEGTSQKNSPGLYGNFEDIDNYFGKALKGREVKEVKRGVTAAKNLFTDMINTAKQGGCPVGPIISFYDELTDHESDELTAKFATAAWWGGQGNTLPSTVWTFGHILSDDRVKKNVYDEIDKYFKEQPDKDGHYDYSKLPYVTSCLKETLRLTTYSIGWRHAQEDVVLTARSGKSYLIPNDTLIGLHFALNHYSPEIFESPNDFKPERFVPYADNLSPVINGVKYAWVPFSAGRHKCSGYPLAMLEIPLAVALFFREYDMEILDPLPGFNFKHAFGVIGPDDQPVRVKYQKRKN